MNRGLLLVLLVTLASVSVTFGVPASVRFGDEDDDNDSPKQDVVGVVEETEDEAEKEAEEEVDEKLENLEGPSRVRRSLSEMIGGSNMHMQLVRRARETLVDVVSTAVNGISLF